LKFNDNSVLLIKNGKIVDGTGKPSFIADIQIAGDKIIKIGKINYSERNTIDAEGLVVSPGFIDIHDHSDSTLLADGRAKSLILQGVTTTIIGNCGYSLAPINENTLDILLGNWLFPMPKIEITWRSFGDFLSRLEKTPLSINVAALVGHGTIRIYVLGMDDRKLSNKEIRIMKKLTFEAMTDGAFGLSTGLAYPPGCYASTEEIVELCKEVTKFDGLYTTHARKEAAGYLDGVREAIVIAKRSNVRIQISHIETHYPAWGEQEEALNLINYARIKGLNIGCDVIPYLWSATSLYTLVPRWVYDGGPKMIAIRMRDKVVRKKVAQEIGSLQQELTTSALAKDGLWDKIKILSYPMNPAIEGKTIKELSQQEQLDPLDLVFDLLGSGPPFPSIMAQSHNENDIRKVIKFDQAIIESDLYSISPSKVGTSRSAHPRGFGTFPLIFRKYVRGETREDLPEERGEKLLSLEEAVRRITSLPAERLKLKDRGILKEGMFADITIFDENRIQDKATYKRPDQYPEGIEYVIVNGRIIVENGKFRNCTPGMVIRRRP